MFCLGAEAHGPGSRANERLTQVVSTYLGILDQITLLNPSTYYESLYVNLETGETAPCVMRRVPGSKMICITLRTMR